MVLGNKKPRPLCPRCRLCFALLLVYSSSTTATVSNNNWTYVPETVILINCGAIGKQTDPDYREWQGDVGFGLASFPDSNSSTVAADADSWLPSIPPVPWMTARIFAEKATYSIPVVGERVFVRLYFYPATYSGGLSVSDAVFDVTTTRQTLLRNFTPAWDAAAINFYYIVREYSLDVSKSGFVNVTFNPSPGSHAFINGIEVISMPDIFTPKLDSLDFVGFGANFDLSPSTALETMYRLNVGGLAVPPSYDSGLFRMWDDDSSHIVGGAVGLTHTIDSSITLHYPPATPRFIAPDSVYSTQRSMTGDVAINRESNLTWSLTVDPGFYYLVRLHFCEIQTIYNKPNKRVFSIYINNETAKENVDVFEWAVQLVGSVREGSGLGVPFYKDYITAFPNGPEKVDLRLDLHPNKDTKPEYVDAVLNGLEIFKINNHSDGSLAGVKPTLRHSTTSQRNKRGYNKADVLIGVSFGGMVVICVFVLVLLAKCKRKRQSIRSAEHKFGKEVPLSIYYSEASRRFTFAEIQEATKGFDDRLVIGVGGFGKVYKGVIRTKKPIAGEVAVAIKRANPKSQQGIREFLNEIEMLSKLRHRHLVSLIGFCNERGEMILVYEYMTNGILRDHLYNNSGKPTLGWRQRLQICVGAATGLHYLHTGIRYTIIHRDVKTTNILLDDSWVAKVADFGLCKAGPEMDRRNIDVSTAVKGSFGYLDPDYFRRQKLTDKSDVYSFGVVLFEVLCSRPAVNTDLPLNQASLAEWARHCHDNGELEKIIDPHLKGQIAPDCFTKFIETANNCIHDSGVNRPSMGDVLCSLEYALQLQDDFDKESGSSTITASCSNSIDRTCMDTDGFITNADIFSEIIDPMGR